MRPKKMEKKKTPKPMEPIKRLQPMMNVSNNIVHWTFLHSLGSAIPSNLKKTLNTPLINHVKSFKIYKTFSDFTRRVTAMAWHPVAPNTVAVGSKGGDVILWNFEQDVQKPRVFFDGIGPGGSIQQLVFDKRNNGRSIFSVSIDGTLSLRDLESGGEESRFLATGTCERWYTSLDVSFPGRAMLAGNNKGFVNLLTVDGELQWEKRLHKQKVKHIEFSPNESWCFVTASVDREMKVWDIRKIKDETSCLFSDTHERGINAAHFSRTDGGSILTTDQNCQLRIYSCPSFSLSHSIHHPHRHFQHLTPIVATWHPLSDVVVVGRYPEGIGHASDDLRTVDFFDGRTGHILHHQFDIQAGKKILSLNLFNHTGDQLMSAASCSVMIWKPNFSDKRDKENIAEEEEEEEEKKKSTGKGKRKPKIAELDLSKVKKLRSKK